MKNKFFTTFIEAIGITDGQIVPVKYDGKVVGHATLKKEVDGKVEVIGEFDENVEDALLDSLFDSGSFSLGSQKTIEWKHMGNDILSS
jgi:hypothetical protein